MQPVGCELIERMVERVGVSHKQRGLSEIVEDEARKGQRKPCEPDRHPAEMTHVGIHRFAACYREKGGAQHREADVEVLMHQEIEGIKRTDCGEHAGRLHDTVDAAQADHQEPGQHDRPEYMADEPSAFLLHETDPVHDYTGYWPPCGPRPSPCALQPSHA